MNKFTVSWDLVARNELGRLWLDNPLSREQITIAADLIDARLAISPLDLGIHAGRDFREYVEPPLKVLFKISQADRLLRVLYVKFWMD